MFLIFLKICFNLKILNNVLSYFVFNIIMFTYKNLKTKGMDQYIFLNAYIFNGFSLLIS